MVGCGAIQPPATNHYPPVAETFQPPPTTSTTALKIHRKYAGILAVAETWANSTTATTGRIQVLRLVRVVGYTCAVLLAAAGRRLSDKAALLAARIAQGAAPR